MTDYHPLNNEPNKIMSDYKININDVSKASCETSSQTDDDCNELGLEDKIFDILNHPDKYDADEIKSIAEEQCTSVQKFQIRCDYILECLYHNPLYFILFMASYIACFTGLILILPISRGVFAYTSVIELIVKSTNNRIIYKIFGENVSLSPLNNWMDFVVYAVTVVELITRFYIHISAFACKITCYGICGMCGAENLEKSGSCWFHTLACCITFNFSCILWQKAVTHLIMLPIVLNSCWRHDELKCYILLITYMKVIYLTLIETLIVWLFTLCNCDCIYGKSFFLYILKHKEKYKNETIQKLIKEKKMHVISLGNRDSDKEITDLECVICSSNFNTKRQIIKLKCSHIFHLSCIANWLDTGSHSCPCCRSDINSSKK
jgi:hypothetical protein